MPGAISGTAPQAVAEDSDQPGRPVAPWWLPVLVEVLGLLCAPVVTFSLLRVRAMSPTDMIDPSFFTGYALHPRTLVNTMGMIYQTSRLGFILPAHVIYGIFGALPGFYILRYLFALVATVPAYVLSRRLHGRAAGAVAVAAILANPVMLSAWGTDYPDSAAVTYLAGGAACLVMPASSKLRRTAWVATAGVLLSLAVHCQFIALLVVAPIVFGYAVTRVRHVRELAGHLLLLVVAGAVTTGALMVAADALYGHANFIAPTLKAMHGLQNAHNVSMWHLPGFQWARYVSYILVPPAVVAAWAVVRVRRRGIPSEELAIVVATAASFLVFFIYQFFGTVWTLQYHYYSSMLWPIATLTTAFAVVAIGEKLLLRAATAWIPAGAVLAVPFVAHFYTMKKSWPSFMLTPTGAFVAVAVVACALVGRLVRRNQAAAPIALTAVVAATFVLTAVRIPYHPPFSPTQLPTGDYADIIGGDGSLELHRYQVSTEATSIIPSYKRPFSVLFWWSEADEQKVNEASGLYLWHFTSLDSDLPTLGADDQKTLRKLHPRALVLLGHNEKLLPAAVAQLASSGFDPTVVRHKVFSAGNVTLAVWVVNLGAFAPHAQATQGQA